MGRIVVGVDGSQGADRALAWAVDEAMLRQADVELVLGYVLRSRRPPFTTEDRELAEEAMEEIVGRNGAVLRRVPWETTVTPLLGRAYADAVLEVGEEAELIVVGSRGLGGFKELLLGSTSLRVASHAPVPVAVVPAERPVSAEQGRDVVVGVDGSRTSMRALLWAVEEADRRGGGVTVVHGYNAPSATLLSGVATPAQIAAESSRARAAADGVLEAVLDEVDLPEEMTVSPRVVAGTSAAAVLGSVAPGDLTVVGTRGYGGIRRALVGSTSHQILHHTSGPVVVVP